MTVSLFTPPTVRPPLHLLSLAKLHIERLAELEAGRALIEEIGEEKLCCLFVQSDFAAECVVRHPEDFQRAFTQSAETLTDIDRISKRFTALQSEATEKNIDAALRRLRSQILVEILWADLCCQATLDRVLAALSAAADAAISIALEFSGMSMHARHGFIKDEQGQAVELGVIAMGKLGGRELNFSSDIDIVFVYRERGDSDGPKPLAAEAYFTRQARRFIRLLDERSAQGFVYRVDVRLRPFGDSGALVVSLDSLESYLASHGRDWERYAYVKARLLGGDVALADELCPILDQFVYRRYLDYSVFESLRDMKRMIETEVRRHDRANNIKLGPGGIREIEFIVQSLQLVRGGAQRELRLTSLGLALGALAKAGHIADDEAAKLGECYEFLRRLENRIQAMRDDQLHALPQDNDDLLRISYAMGFERPEAMQQKLDAVRDCVASCFSDSVFREEERSEDSQFEDVWSGDVQQIDAALAFANVDDSADLAVLIAAYRKQLLTRPVDVEGRQRLDRLMPLLLASLASYPQATVRWQRITKVLDAILRRSAYMSLLIENRSALDRLIELGGGNAYLADQLAANPALLDVLLDARVSSQTIDLKLELDAALAQVDPDDTESLLHAVMGFQRAASFQVAVADVSGQLELMRVSDRLTHIAEHVIEIALATAWRECVRLYGSPRPDIADDEPALAVIAYGKLGGCELSYGSDLDLVFIHDCDPGGTTIGGERSLSNEVFFVRLTRKLLHYLTFQSAVGPMYEVDIRLRPSGRSGMLVTSLSSFAHYQSKDAWTWEHQALLRARAVAGSQRIATQFDDIRALTLGSHVRRATLSEQVNSMRKRMRKELSRSKPGQFDLKQDVGGLADIEFLVQYLVLAHAHTHPELTQWSDNIRQIEDLLKAEVLGSNEADQLSHAYIELRAEVHRRSLNSQSQIVPEPEFSALRDTVRSLWTRYFDQS